MHERTVPCIVATLVVAEVLLIISDATYFAGALLMYVGAGLLFGYLAFWLAYFKRVNWFTLCTSLIVLVIFSLGVGYHLQHNSQADVIEPCPPIVPEDFV